MSAESGLLLLDRDGVINELVVDAEQGTVDSPLHPSQVRLIPGAPEALRRFAAAGWGLVIVSNQPAAAKGKTAWQNLEAVQAKVLSELFQDGVRILASYLCFHRAEDHCLCRKPHPGLLKQAFDEHPEFAAAGSWMVGDGITDVEAGQALGLRTAFIAPHKAEFCHLLARRSVQPTLWVDDLADFAKQTLAAKTESSALEDGFGRRFLEESRQILQRIDSNAADAMAHALAELRGKSGRLFILGVGGSAAHASHAVNDFRKLCGIEAYAPTDNVSELTARTNDEGWESTFVEWLKISRLRSGDGVLVLSVGGGNREKNISVNLVRALDWAKQAGATIFGIIGRDGGYARAVADHCLLIPALFAERVTPHTEGLCAVMWHLLVSHPALQQTRAKWESVEPPIAQTPSKP